MRGGGGWRGLSRVDGSSTVVRQNRKGQRTGALRGQMRQFRHRGPPLGSISPAVSLENAEKGISLHLYISIYC